MRTESNTMERTRGRLVLDHAFWGMAALALGIVPDRSIDTASVDGRVMRFNDEWFETLTAAEQDFVCAHEVSHCVLGHIFRIGGREPELANIAADHVVNLDLIDSGFKPGSLPILADPRFRGWSFEKVYGQLAKERDEAKPKEPETGNASPDASGNESGAGSGSPENASQPGPAGSPEPGQGKPQPQPGNNASDSTAGQNPGSGTPGTPEEPGKGAGTGQPGAGSGSGSGSPENWGTFEEATDEGLQPGETRAEDLQHEWEKLTETLVAVSDKAGTMPGSLRRSIEESHVKREELGEVLQRYLTSKNAMSYATPNRKLYARGLKLPGRCKSSMEELVVAVDTSGSIDKGLLSYFADKLNEVLAMDEPPQRITVIYCDTAVRGVDEQYEGTASFDPIGGGGTKFKPVFDKVEELGLRPDALLYFTDLYNESSERLSEPEYPVLWIAPIQSNREPNFGEVVRVDPYASL